MALRARDLLDRAHLLSLVRIPLAALLWVRPTDTRALLALVALAAITDVLDGIVGRRIHPARSGTANTGAWLDPVCDKLFALSAILVIAVFWGAPWPLLALVALRDVAMAPLTLGFRVVAGADAFHAHDFRARPSGKATTVAQILTLAAVVLAPRVAWPLAVATGLLGVIALAERVLLAWRQAHPGPR